MSDSMFIDLFETLKSKGAYKNGFFSEYSLDGGSCEWKVNCADKMPWPLHC